MRTNGYLNVQVQQEPIFDVHGVPNWTESQWGESISCNIQINTRSNKGTYQDGNFTTCKYEVFIETMQFEASRIKLNMKGRYLGEFAVQDIQVLDGVGRIKIIV